MPESRYLDGPAIAAQQPRNTSEDQQTVNQGNLEATPPPGQGGFLEGSPLKKYLKDLPAAAPKGADQAGVQPSPRHAAQQTHGAPTTDLAPHQHTILLGLNLGSARSCIAGGGTRVAVDTCALGPGSAGGGMPNNESPTSQEVRSLLTYLVGLTNPDPEASLCAAIGVPAQASRMTKQSIIEASRGILDRVMLVPEPFAVAYGLDRTDNALVIDIGAATTDLCRLSGAFPTPDDHLSLPVAGNTVDRKLYDLIKAELPDAEITLNVCKQVKERHGFVSSPTGPVHARFTTKGQSAEHDLSEHLYRACRTIVEPTVTAIHQLLATAHPAHRKTLLNNIIVSGGGAMLDGLDQRLLRELATLGGAQITIVDDPLYAAATGALKLAQDVPATYWQQLV